MKIDRTELGKIYERIKSKKDEYLTGYIPDNRISAFILATEPYLDEVQDLAALIEK